MLKASAICFPRVSREALCMQKAIFFSVSRDRCLDSRSTRFASVNLYDALESEFPVESAVEVGRDGAKTRTLSKPQGVNAESPPGCTALKPTARKHNTCRALGLLSRESATHAHAPSVHSLASDVKHGRVWLKSFVDSGASEFFPRISPGTERGSGRLTGPAS